MSDGPSTIGPHDISALAAGAAIFGTGGGGAVQTVQAAVEADVTRHGPVPLRRVQELTAEDAVLVMSAVGAPGAGIEMLPAAGQPELIVTEAERLAGRRVTAIMSAEIGGANGVAPVGWAARMGLSVLDADGMGRAFPEAPMISMNVAGLPCTFCILSDVVGNVSVLRPVDLTWLERHGRALTTASGSLCLGAHYLLTADTTPGAVIEGSVSRAIEVGRRVHASSEPIVELQAALGAAALVSGKITEVERRVEGGFTRGSVVIDGTGTDRGRVATVEIQNENLVVIEGGEVVVSVPDLITIVDTETGDAIATELVRFGQRVTLLAWPCDPLWRTPRGVEIAGPRAFGYDLAYRPFTASRTPT